jgi:hypothetical protein
VNEALSFLAEQGYNIFHTKGNRTNMLSQENEDLNFREEQEGYNNIAT